MKILKIDFDEIQKAMEDIVRDSFDYYLDLHSGKVIVLSEDILGDVKARLCDSELDDLGDDIEYVEFSEEPTLPYWMEDEIELVLEVHLARDGRYNRIPERSSSEAHTVMAEFIETVKNPVLKEELTYALNGKGAFRRFKDVLINDPKERKRWHGYNAKAMKKVIVEWLKSSGIESEQIYPGNKEKEADHVREAEL